MMDGWADRAGWARGRSVGRWLAFATAASRRWCCAARDGGVHASEEAGGHNPCAPRWAIGGAAGMQTEAV